MNRAVLLLLLLGCGLEERGDFLVGRECKPELERSCEDEQTCLPHAWSSVPADFRCRDLQSFEQVEGRDPPLAYCDPAGTPAYRCPPGAVCAPDRVRALDGGVRRTVCMPPGSPFGPPP